MITELDSWFVTKVLPLEGALVRYLRRNMRDHSEIADLRQEVYARVYDAARNRLPTFVKPFVFATARNLLVDRARRARIVSIDVADMEVLHVSDEMPGPDRHVEGRHELQRLQTALDRLPPRCREVVMLMKIERLSQREVAARMGITENTVETQMKRGMQSLADALFGSAPRLGRQAGVKKPLRRTRHD